MRELTAHIHTQAALDQHEQTVGTSAFADELQNLRYFVAVTEEGRVVGCGGCSISPEEASARIREVFVHPGWARRGIATELVSRAIDEARRANVAAIWVRSSTLAVPLYESLGFTQVGETRSGPLPTVRLELHADHDVR